MSAEIYSTIKLPPPRKSSIKVCAACHITVGNHSDLTKLDTCHFLVPLPRPLSVRRWSLPAPNPTPSPSTTQHSSRRPGQMVLQ